jgi:hypothetical protein
MFSWIQGMRRWRTALPDSTGRVALPTANATHVRQLPRSRSPPSGLENFPEPAKLVTETAGIKAELRQQIGVLAIVGVYLIRELLAGLLSLVVVALALQQLHNLVFADVHDFPFPQTGEAETPGSALPSANAFLAFSLQCGSTLPPASGSPICSSQAGSLTSPFPGGSPHLLC